MKYHAYKQPAAGWQGYVETKAGKVSAWVAVDGTVVPASAIK